MIDKIRREQFIVFFLLLDYYSSSENATANGDRGKSKNEHWPGAKMLNVTAY